MPENPKVRIIPRRLSKTCGFMIPPDSREMVQWEVLRTVGYKNCNITFSP